MTKPIIRNHNIVTNEIEDRQMNNVEFSQWQIDQKAAEKQQAEATAKEAQRQALLEKLGITAEEAQLLFG